MTLKELFTAWLTDIKALKERLAKAEADLAACQAERNEAKSIEEQISTELRLHDPSAN